MTEVEQFYSLLVAGIGWTRKRDRRLEYLAAQRTVEAREQVGLNATGTASDLIVHPSQDVLEARLGEDWHLKGVGELGTWGYQFLKPIEALVDYTSPISGRKFGLLNTEPHRTILMDASYKYWGCAIYDELPAGEPELNRRRYGIVILSKEAPIVKAVVVSGEAFADAIVAGPLAARNGASIFLVQRASLPNVTREALEDLDPDEIIIVGGVNVVETVVEDALMKIAPVRRLAGNTRFDTAAIVAES